MERLDELFINNLKIYQDDGAFCFGTDSVLLAWFAFSKKATALCDLCSGTGVIPLLASAKTLCKKIYGVELLPITAALAKKSVSFNKLDEKVEIVEGDLRCIEKLLPAAALDLVTANPPYMPKNAGFLSESARKGARAETSCTIDEVAKSARYLLKNKGRLCVVYRADRLAEVFAAMQKNGIEPKRLVLVQSKPENAPYIALCEGIVGAAKGIKIEKNLIIHENGKTWSYQKQNAEGDIK